MHLFTKKKRNWKTPLFWSMGILSILLLLLVISLPLFFSSDSLKPQIENALSQQLGQNVQVNGFVSFRLFPRAFIRAKKIQIGEGKDQISIEKMDFHTSLFSLFRSTSLVSDLTLHKTHLAFDSFDQMWALLGGAYHKGLKNISLKNADLHVGKDHFESVDFTLYEEDDIRHFSLKGNFRDIELGLTGRLHETDPQPFQGVFRFVGGRRLNMQGHIIPQTKKIKASVDGSFPMEVFGDSLLKQFSFLKISGELETDFSTFTFSDVLLSGKDFSFGGHVSYEDVLKVRGQLHQVPAWAVDPAFVENLLMRHPVGVIDIVDVVKGASAWQTKRTKDSLIVEQIHLRDMQGDSLYLQGTTFFDPEFSFDGKIDFEKEKQSAVGKLFVTPSFLKIYEASFGIGSQAYRGSVQFNRQTKDAEVVLETDRLDLSKTSFPFDLTGRFAAKEIYFGDRVIAQAQFKGTLSKGRFSFDDLVGQMNGEMVLGEGGFDDDSFVLKLSGTDGRFLSAFLPGIFDLPLFPKENVQESTLEIKDQTFAVMQKNDQETAHVVARVESDTVHGQLTYHSDTLAPLIDSLPYLKDKVLDNTFMFTGRFTGKKNYFEMPDVTLRLGGNAFHGQLSKMFLDGENAWSVSLKGDKLVWSSLFNTASFRPDIWDDTALPNWDFLLSKKIEFSLSLTNLIGTRLGHAFSIDLNTKLMPMQLAMRFHQKDGDARLHFTQQDGLYKGFVHTKNYHLPEALLGQDSIDLILGLLTMESEFETQGQTPHQLFKNAIASFDIKSKDGTLIGLSPYHAVWNAKEALPRGQGAVRDAIMRGLKTGQAPLKTFSCRGVLKAGKVTVRYGRFASEDFEDGTFESVFYPLKKKIKFKSRFGLKGLSPKPIDVQWRAEDSLVSPEKTITISSPYAYDPAYLKRLRKKSRRH
ncbi:MAG: AsmA family protein [Alphaproteobacteria bacterium]|nr:AsmA family protein [Alphaproteobacteria bacterium]MBN2780077.1 AsmA family protein [Alphaproteobacteria bacterium]